MNLTRSYTAVQHVQVDVKYAQKVPLNESDKNITAVQQEGCPKINVQLDVLCIWTLAIAPTP